MSRDRRSFRSKIAETLISLKVDKEAVNTPEGVANKLKERQIENEKPYVIPRTLIIHASVVESSVDGMQVFSLSPKDSKSEKRIIYLHGGAYVNQPSLPHWTFLQKIVDGTNASIIFPIYPKAPVHNYQEAYDKVLSLYENMLQKTQSEDIVLMGDSAGAGFALGLSQLLLEKNLDQPSDIILISPWLDITMKNPAIAALEDKDPMLGSYSLIQDGKAWAGDSNPDNFMLSPINGPIKGLGHITLFIGTHELFLPDAQLFRDMAKEQGVDITYYEYSKMNHIFVLFPIPEAHKATEQIVRIINGR